MYAGIGTLLPFALGIAINPASIIAVILLLTSNQGGAKGLAYLLGWLVGLITLAFASFLIVFSRDNTAAQLTAWLITIAGLTLLVIAYVQWRQRPPPEAEIASLEWLRTVPRSTSSMALSAGLYFGLFSVKNLLLTAAAAMVIREADLSLDKSIRMVLFFVALATSGIAVPVFIWIARKVRARTVLANWEHELTRHHIAITCAVLVIIALQLLGIGLGGLLGA